MYKVLIAYDKLTHKYFFDNDIRNSIEIVYSDNTENICDLIKTAEPDVVVLDLKAFKDNKKELFVDSSNSIKSIYYLVIYNHQCGEEQEEPEDEFANQYHFLELGKIGDICVELEIVTNKLKSNRAKENFEKMLLQEADRVKPIIKEQFLKEFIFGIGDTGEIFEIYCQTFNVDVSEPIRMFIFRPEQTLEFEDMLFLKNIIEGHMGSSNIMFSSVINDYILLIINVYEGVRVCKTLHKLEHIFKKYFSYKVTMVFSGTHPIKSAPTLYERMNKCVEYCFYTKGENIIFAEDFVPGANTTALEPNYGAIERAVKSGDIEKVQLLMCNFFKDIDKAKVEPAVAKTYCLELFVCIIRCCEVEKIDKYMKGIIVLQNFRTLSELKNYIINIALEIVQANSPVRTKVYSSLISSTMEIIEKNLGNERLSLRWIANGILYTNVDYLGKLFKKETGENFSHYVMEKRMEMAKKLIIEGKKDRIYEVAEKVGYGSNSQYFSQVFKKYTGASPLEYKEYARFSVIG